MKTFTTYAEKKAKQFLNLLQGYTKGIRMTAILILLLMGVSNAWAYTVYLYTGSFTDWEKDDAGFRMWDGSANQNFTKIGTNWYSCTTTKTGTMYIKRGNAAHTTDYNGNQFSANISSTDNVVKVTGWGSGALTSLHITGDNWGGIGDWSNNNDAGKMAISSGTTFTKTLNNVTAAAHEFKITFGGTWDNAIGYSSSNVSCVNGTVGDNGGNIKFTPYIAGNVTITYDVSNGKVVITCPAPTITFDVEGGSGGTQTQEAPYGTATSAITVPTKTGYTFSGYYNGDNGTGTQIIGTDGKWIKSNTDFTDADNKWIVTSNKTLYAKWTAKQYNITYKDQGDVAFSGTHASDNPTTHTYGTATTLKSPSKTGYTFDGWFTTQDCSGSAVSTLGATAYTANITLYAKWTIKEETKYDVTISSAGNGTVEPSGNQKVGASGIDVTAKPNTGYVFEKWTNTDGANAVPTSTATTKVTATANGTITAYFKEIMHDITIKSANETQGTVSPASVTAGIATGSANITASPKEGYEFVNWTAGSGITLADANSATTKVTKATAAGTVTANFKETTHTVTIKSNNNTYGTVSPTNASVGQHTAVSITATTKAGYRFVNWTTEDAGITIADPTNKATTITATTTGTVTANFELIPPTTIYLKPNSDWKSDNARFAAYVWTDNVGNEWIDMKDVGCSGDYYYCEVPAKYAKVIFGRMNPSTTANNFNDGVKWNQTGDQTIPTDNNVLFTVTDWGNGSWGTYSAPQYAITINNGTGGTVTVKQGGNTIASGTQVALNSSITATLNASEGYTKGTAKIKIGNNTETNLVEGQEYTICGPTTITGNWTANTYTVAFDANGGTGTMANQSFTYAAAKALTTNTFTRTGYTFAGWNTQADGEGTSYTDKQSVQNLTTENNGVVTLYAQWTPNTYTVKFNKNDVAATGTAMADLSFTYDVEQALTANTFQKENWKFKEWNTKDDGSGQSYSDQQSVKNLTATNNGTVNLYAQWVPAADTYTITIRANGNGTVSPESVIVNKSISATITATPQECYKFTGWVPEGGAEVADKSTVSTANASSTTVTASAAGSVTANFEALLPNTLNLTEVPVYIERENPLTGAGGDGSEDTPYKIYSEEFVRITAEALPEVEGLTAYYKFGDTEQEENVFNFTDVSGTTPSKITVKAYYKKNDAVWGGEVSADSHYFLRIPLPFYVSTVPSGEMSLDQVAKGEDILVQFRSDKQATVNLYVQKDAGEKVLIEQIQNTASYDFHYTVPDDSEPCVLRFIAESDGLLDGRSFSKYAEVALYKNVTIKVNDPKNVLRKVYMWRGEDIKTQWPGEDFIKTFGTWRIFTVKYPYYDHFILNDGTQENQTFDYIIPAEDKCYQLSENKVEVGGYTNYQITETTCPSDLLVGDIDAVTVGVGEQKVVIPAVEVGLGYQISDLKTAVSSSNTSKATAVVSGKNIIVTGKATGTATITVTYKLDGTTVEKTFNVTVAVATSVTIQVKVPIGTKENGYDKIGWDDNSKLYLHYWFSDNTNANIPLTYIGEETGKYKHLQAEVPLHTDGKTNFLLYYEYLNEEVWRKSPDVKNVTTDGCYAMKNEGFGKQPSISRSGNYCWAEYQVKTLMQSGKEFTSNIVADADGIMSFFAPGKDETGRKAGAVMLYCNGSVVAAIDPATFETSTVYTATINDEGNGLANVAPYTGNYYIRTWGKDNDISNKGTQSVSTWTDAEKSSRSMTFFISREGEYYNHYWVQAMAPYNGGKDVSAWVANDYNDDLAGKLTGDKNTNENGDIKFDNTMNVRFGYDPRTNYFGRALLRGSGQNEDYLNLHCNNAYSDAACTKKLPYGTSVTANKFRDISNWVYEREVYVKIDNNNPSASMYIEAKSPHNTKDVYNYLLGYVINEVTGEETSTPIQKIVIASGTDNGVYKIRVVYDFKTNRMISVWEPNGDIEVNTKKTLKTDILFLRKENNPAPQITLTGDGRINSIQSVFFALELQRGDADKANRHEEQYMFTLPFDCVVGSISGVPGYMEVWGIQRYRGDLRAQKGWFIETPTFWEWMSLTDTLKAGEGYLLAFDKKNAHWEEFLEEDLVTKTSLLRLYFPSIEKGFDLQQQSTEQLTRTYENHTCTITRDDRHLQDSNWKMIGTTSYNNAKVDGYVEDTDPEYEELNGNTPPNFRYTYTYKFDNNNNRTSYTYTPEDGKTATYQSFYGYMVQFAGTITWSPMNETVPEKIAARRNAEYKERTSVTTRLELANAEGEKQDQTFVALDEKATTTFDQNKDLNKVFNSGKANIYTLSEDIPFAGNTLPMEEAVVPVGVDIATAGEYTFRMPDGTEGMVVELLDYEANTRTNLLLSDYTVTLQKGSNENRFALYIQPSKSGVTTGVGNIGDEAKGDKAKGIEKYLIDGKLIIRTAEGIFDAQGHRL